MRSCFRPSKFQEQKLLGPPVSILLRPKVCDACLHDAVLETLPHLLANFAQFEHSFHDASFRQPASKSN